MIPVWGRADVVTTSCPKSLITVHSLFYLDHFRWWKEGGGSLLTLDAKVADAIVELERAWQMEIQRGET